MVIEMNEKNMHLKKIAFLAYKNGNIFTESVVQILQKYVFLQSLVVQLLSLAFSIRNQIQSMLFPLMYF